MRLLKIVGAGIVASLAVGVGDAQKYKTPIPPDITVQGTVETCRNVVQAARP